MRDITTKITLREMYELVRDDATIMEIDRAIEDIIGEKGFQLSTFGSSKDDLDAKLSELKVTREMRVEAIFRSRLNRLDREQLVSLIMTGEFPMHIRTLEESGIVRKPAAPTIELFASRTDEILAAGKKRKFGRKPVRRTEPTVSDSPDTSVVESPAPAAHPAEPSQACVQRKKPKFRRKTTEQKAE